MRIEIGSEFWLDEFDLNNPKPRFEWNNYLEHSFVLTSSGRSAISTFIKNIDPIVKNKVALLPAYICSSVIDPFLINGYKCIFYDINTKLEPDLDSILSYNLRDIGVFLHLGYYGFQTNTKLAAIISELKKLNIIIVEDITHTLFSERTIHHLNDYLVGSLRKWFALPSGGILSSTTQIRNLPVHKHKLFYTKRKDAFFLKGQYMINHNQELKTKYLQLFKDADRILSDDVGSYLIDEFSEQLMTCTNVNELIEKRRSNFKELLILLRDCENIKPVFEYLPEGVCPFFFPIYIGNNRDAIRNRLVTNNVYCTTHWPIPHNLNIQNHLQSQLIYSNILSIPCDQRYDHSDMKHIVDLLIIPNIPTEVKNKLKVKNKHKIIK